MKTNHIRIIVREDIFSVAYQFNWKSSASNTTITIYLQALPPLFDNKSNNCKMRTIFQIAIQNVKALVIPNAINS